MSVVHACMGWTILAYEIALRNSIRSSFSIMQTLGLGNLGSQDPENLGSRNFSCHENQGSARHKPAFDGFNLGCFSTVKSVLVKLYW